MQEHLLKEIKCKVKDTAPFGKKLTNLAEIAEYADNMGADILDRDSKKDNMNIPADEDLPYYKDNEINKVEEGKDICQKDLQIAFACIFFDKVSQSVFNAQINLPL